MKQIVLKDLACSPTFNAGGKQRIRVVLRMQILRDGDTATMQKFIVHDQYISIDGVSYGNGEYFEAFRPGGIPLQFTQAYACWIKRMGELVERLNEQPAAITLDLHCESLVHHSQAVLTALLHGSQALVKSRDNNMLGLVLQQHLEAISPETAAQINKHELACNG